MDKFKIDSKSPIPVWAQTKSRLLYLIMSGFYKEGEKLPTVRDLAVDYGINYNTANKVYRDLERDGFVETIRGKGCYVTDKARTEFFVIDNDIDFLIQELIDKGTTVGMTGQEIVMRVIGRLSKEGLITKQAIAEVKEDMRKAV